MLLLFISTVIMVCYILISHTDYSLFHKQLTDLWIMHLYIDHFKRISRQSQPIRGLIPHVNHRPLHFIQLAHSGRDRTFSPFFLPLPFPLPHSSLAVLVISHFSLGSVALSNVSQAGAAVSRQQQLGSRGASCRRVAK